MILFSEKISSRLLYITDFISNEILLQPIEVTNRRDIFAASIKIKINYSPQRITDKEYWINPHNLLFEEGIQQQHIDCFTVNEHKAFFKSEGDHPFDIFAASFYLISRYEEYLPHTKDIYGRYAHENSLAYKEGFLNIPLANIWWQNLIEKLASDYSLFTIHYSPFTFLPTYDIDIAYSYKGKGFSKTIAGFTRSLFTGNFAAFAERLKVLSGKQTDPYDTFDWMDELHKKYDLKPIYFFLVPENQGKYDKNILPSHPFMQLLIKRTSDKYAIAIHPSWKSGDDENLLHEEISRLKNISNKEIDTNRFHYVRFNIPYSYRRLIQEGITKDHSMGYGSINGFRASVASPFYWYDLEKEEQTNLKVYPFCFMEANSYYEQKFTVEQTLEEIRYYHKVVKSVNGTLITLWHNHFFGTSKEFAGLKEVYETLIKELAT